MNPLQVVPMSTIDDSTSVFEAAEAGSGAEAAPVKSASAATSAKRCGLRTLLLAFLGIIAGPFCAEMSNIALRRHYHVRLYMVADRLPYLWD